MKVSLQKTGGFAGVFQSLVVETDGSWTFGNSKGGPSEGGATRTGKLTAAQRAELTRLTNLPAFAKEAGNKGGAKCNDGFFYALVAGSVAVAWSDCGSTTPPTASSIANLLATATPI